jgi:[ribosomal protein S18]-alanine N-acetyltransferase
MGSTIRSSVQLRRARTDELAVVMAIDAATWVRPLPEAEWNRALEDAGFVLFVAVLDGEVVGYMAYKVFADFINLYRIAVRPDSRRRGIGLEMLLRLQCTLATTRRDHIQLFVGTRNESAIRLYRRCDFHVDRLEPSCYGPGEDAYVMVCDVRSHRGIASRDRDGGQDA